MRIDDEGPGVPPEARKKPRVSSFLDANFERILELVPLVRDETGLQVAVSAGILNAEEELRNARLGLAKATQQVLANGLALLGVSAPESM